MKLNPDCIRSVLLEIEYVSLNESISFTELCDKLKEYKTDEIAYTCIKLKEAAFIEACIIAEEDLLEVINISDITYSGHQFLANIRENKIWNGTKSICEKIGSKSLDTIVAVSSNVVAALIKQHFGITV